MSITDDDTFFFVKLEFPVANGLLHWSVQVVANDEEGAVKQATGELWSEMDFKGVKPKVKVAECYEVDGHLADPFSHDYHEETVE